MVCGKRVLQGAGEEGTSRAGSDPDHFVELFDPFSRSKVVGLASTRAVVSLIKKLGMVDTERRERDCLVDWTKLRAFYGR